MRIGVGLVQQETNTFSVNPCTWDDFTIRIGSGAAEHTVGTNSEMGGALTAIATAGHEAVPLVYAWAMPSGVVTKETLDRLRTLLTDAIRKSGSVDALVLCLHGAMAADGEPDADGALIETARAASNDSAPIGVSLDLHANVTERMVACADAIVGYHTDPHVDMAETGRRVSSQLIAFVDRDVSPSVALAKRPMIVPAESMNTTTGPLGPIRSSADAEGGALDISLFPVQPWLDVPELGFGVLVTTDGDAEAARVLAEHYADRVWGSRGAFAVPNFLGPDAAVRASRDSDVRPFVIAESADAPTAGAAGDSPVMVEALMKHGSDLESVVPVVDPAAVASCHELTPGDPVDLVVGAGVDPRWHRPVRFTGIVAGLGSGVYRLAGEGYGGLEVDMGRYAVVRGGTTSLLLSEKPAWTADPATYAAAGIDVEALDVLVVRSCSDFRPNFPDSAEASVTLDVPGTASPRFEALEFTTAGRPLWPLDEFPADVEGRSPH